MIEWIVTSSALILLVLVLRLIVRERVSPRLRYALWGLVLLRLLVPGTVFESRASVMTPIAVQETRQEPEDFQGFSIPSTPDPYLDSVPAEIVDPVAMGQSFLDPGMYFPPEEPPSPKAENTFDWNVVSVGIWLAGAAAVTLFLVGVNLKFARQLKKNRRALEQYCGRRVFVVDGLATPCLFGLFLPSVYLTPEVVEDEAAKAHVLAHEYTHFRQGDHIWALLRDVCLAVHWYNPLAWAAAVLSRRDCELSCDEGAIRLLGEECRADYGRTLVGLVARRTTAVDLARCATTMTGGKSALKERVALLVKRPKTTAVMAVIVAAACAVFAVCTFTGAAEAEHSGAPPVQPKDGPQDVDFPLPSLDELPTEVLSAYTLGDLVDNTEPYWLLDQLYEEDIAIYTANPMETAYELRGVYLRYGNHLQYFDQQICPYIYVRPHLTWYDFDEDGDNELLVVYANDRAVTMDVNELVVYEWEGSQWSEHKYDPARLMADFNENAVFESSGGISRISYQGQDVQVPLGGEECFIRGSVVKYILYGKDGWGILMSLTGEIGPVLTSTNYCFDYMCDIYYHPDGSFTAENGIFSSLYEDPELPALEDLPTELYDPDTPGWGMSPIWLLAELPEEDIAVYSMQGENQRLLRYGTHLQWIGNVWGGNLPPELYWQDFDYDSDMELAVIDRDTSQLFVYEWDGQSWTGSQANVEQGVMDDFNAEHTLTLYPEAGTAELSFKDSTVLIDMDAAYGDMDWRGGTSVICKLSQFYSSYAYDVHRSGIYLHFYGGIHTGDGIYKQRLFHFLYTVEVTYQDGKFEAAYDGWGPGLTTPYPYFAVTPVFREILRDFVAECQEMWGEDTGGDRFAICDVNGDGRDELVTQCNIAAMAGQVEQVYDADGNLLLSGYPLMTYYDNGYAVAGWSHNQGKAGDKLWPYTLYKFDPAANRYEPVASVDGWDKELGDTYSDGSEIIPFPDDADKDGDGFVYYIITEDGGYAPAYGTPVDYAEWVEWANAYLGGNAVHVPYQSLSKENIALIG